MFRRSIFTELVNKRRKLKIAELIDLECFYKDHCRLRNIRYLPTIFPDKGNVPGATMEYMYIPTGKLGNSM